MSEWIDFLEIDLNKSEYGYLTMGMYYDIIMTYCGKALHENGGFTLFPHKSVGVESVAWPRSSLDPDFSIDVRSEIEANLVDASTECVLMNFGLVSVGELDPATYGKPVKEYIPDPIQEDEVPVAIYLGGQPL